MSGLSCDPCDIIQDLGCYPACGPVTLPLYAPINGTYTLKVWKGGGWILKEFVVTDAPTRLVVESIFPENSDSVFQIIDPNGYLFKYSILRDRLGVKDLANPPDTGCCDGCITLFKINTSFNFLLVDDEISAETLSGNLLNVIHFNEDVISGFTVTLAHAIAKEFILYVEVDQLKVDHQDEALPGFMYWTIAGNTITFSEELLLVNVKVAYIKL